MNLATHQGWALSKPPIFVVATALCRRDNVLLVIHAPYADRAAALQPKLGRFVNRRSLGRKTLRA